MTDGRILVWGAGAIGGTVGAFFARAGHAVTFVDGAPEHVAAIRGPVEDFTVQAPARLPPGVTGVWAHHTEDACRALLPHLADEAEQGRRALSDNNLLELLP